jgi:hypothetical protein
VSALENSNLHPSGGNGDLGRATKGTLSLRKTHVEIHDAIHHRKFDARLLREKAAIELAGAPRELKQLKANIQSFMSMLQKTPGRVVKYFNSTKLHYCA